MAVGMAVASAIEDTAIAIETYVLDNPEIIAAIGLAFILVIIGLLLFHWYRRRKPAQRLVRVLRRFDDVAIIMHPNPDPDAMGAAVGMKELAEASGTPATIYYSGQIRHHENRAFRNVLDLELEELENADQLDEDGIVLVDHNEPRGFLGSGGVSPDIVVDHHPGGGTGTYFTDVREDYGACASILADYFETLDAVPTNSQNGAERTDGGTSRGTDRPRLSADIATGLLYGIQSDTKQLTTGCSRAEFEASSYLYPGIDADKLRRIANPQVTTEMLEIKAKAITDRITNGSFAISDVGEVTDIDAIAQAAEELSRLEGVSAVVVYGSKDGTIHLSGRSNDDRVHMGRTLKTVFEDVPMASAGGHARMGGGQVPLQYLAGIGPSSVDDDRARSDLRGMIFNAMKGNT